MFDTRRIALFSLQKRLSKHKMTIFSKHLWGTWPLSPPRLRLCYRIRKGVVTEHSLVAKGGSSKWVKRGDFRHIWQASLITGSLQQERWSILHNTAVIKNQTTKCPYTANAFFRILQNHGEKKLLFQVLRSRSLPHWIRPCLSQYKTNSERLWFNSADKDKNFWAEIHNDLTASNRRSSTPFSRNTPLSFSRVTRSYAFSRSTKDV